MKSKLTPIFLLRKMLLKRANPQFFNENEKYITKTSMAAQDYFISGAYDEYDHIKMGRSFRNLPGYVAIHKKYKLPYNPTTPISVPQKVNPGLVMDLAWSFDTDIRNNIIDNNGNIKDSAKLHNSEVLQVYHNSEISGVPTTMLKILPKSELIKILADIERGGR